MPYLFNPANFAPGLSWKHLIIDAEILINVHLRKKLLPVTARILSPTSWALNLMTRFTPVNYQTIFLNYD